MTTRDLEKKVLRAYRALDRQIRDFKLRSGLRCGSLCGVCCESSCVEATPLECLPLAREIFRREQEEAVSLALDRHADADDSRCALYRPDPENPEQGRCAWYPFRPLICRLFGYTVRKNKYGKPELSLCRVMLRDPEVLVKLTQLSTEALEQMHPPVYQSSFLSVASLDPATGFHLLPINQALREAMEYVYWHRPKTWSGYRKAA